jgi:hypothetical protein
MKACFLLLVIVCLGCAAPIDDEGVSFHSQALQTGGQYFCNASGAGACLNQNIQIIYTGQYVTQNGANKAVSPLFDFNAAKATSQHFDFVLMKLNRYQIRVRGTNNCMFDSRTVAASGDTLTIGACPATDNNASEDRYVWTFDGEPGAFFRLRPVSNASLCLSVSSFVQNAKQPMKLLACGNDVTSLRQQHLVLDDTNLPHCPWVSNGVSGVAGRTYQVRVRYAGGALHGSNPVYMSLWGSGNLPVPWGSFSTDTGTLFSAPAFWSRLAEYGQFSGSLAGLSTFSTKSDGSGFGPNCTNSAPCVVPDSLVISEIKARITAGTLLLDPDGIYAIQMSNELLEGLNTSPPGNGAGHHGWFNFNGANLRYVTMNPGGAYYQLLVDHEVTEAITDPEPPYGWFDPQFLVEGIYQYGGEGEVGDICNAQFATVGGVTTAHKVWSQAACACISVAN